MKLTCATLLASSLLGMTLFLSACNRASTPSSSSTEAVVWQAVVADQLLAFENAGLPEVSEDDLSEFLEMMELADGQDHTAKRFHTRLQETDRKRLTAALLTLVEDRNTDIIDKRRAYAWLRIGDESMMPRLTLRLKYEKDWLANVDIAIALLTHGSGAGLQALVHILEVEEDPNQSSLSLVRYAAMEALKALPPSAGWQPSSDFNANWQRLLEVQHQWDFYRQLPDSPPVVPSEDQQAEMWRMMQRLRSQPLRPVDDARFVLVRLPNWAFDPISRTTMDENRYVREHALQTMAWIGYPIGRWAKQQKVDLLSRLRTGLQDMDLRPRVLEAMGASGLSSMQTTLLAWLQQGNLEEATAAADALLRCADANAHAEISTVLQSAVYLSPEARYSLQLLVTASKDLPNLKMPAGLDSSSAKRRNRWRQERDSKP